MESEDVNIEKTMENLKVRSLKKNLKKEKKEILKKMKNGRIYEKNEKLNKLKNKK